MYHELDFLLFDALRQAGRIMRAHRPHGEHGGCPEHGAPPVKREMVLAILSDHKGAMRQNQLASAFRVSPSTLSEMLNKLEADGLLERTTDTSDRRATLLTLTDRGAARVDEIREVFRSAFARIFGRLSEDEKRQLILLLGKIGPPEDAVGPAANPS